MGEKERRWQPSSPGVSRCQPQMSIFIRSGLLEVSCTKDFSFFKDVTFVFFIFSLPLTGFFPYSLRGVNLAAEEPYSLLLS